jgi:hypothetical protein
MENFMTDALTRRRRGYVRQGIVKVLPVRRSNDWLPENADSAFMNTGAKIEYVVPRLISGQLIDPLGDLSEEQKNQVAKQLGYKDASDLNINKEEKSNYWVNKPVMIDKNGKHLDLSNTGDFINYKILETNLDYIAPSWEERYNKGTYKFALVFEEEESKLKNLKIDTKKEAYMMFGKIDGSVKKLSDFLWIHYLTNKEGKRLPNNPPLEYLRQEVGRIIEERPGEFLSIVTDTLFETKALIQKAINIGLIQRDGMTFKVFGEESSRNTLDGLINYLLDERNNNIRISLIGKIEANEAEGLIQKPSLEERKQIKEMTNHDSEILEKINKLENTAKSVFEMNQKLKEENEALRKQLTDVPKKKPGRSKKEDSEKVDDE